MLFYITHYITHYIMLYIMLYIMFYIILNIMLNIILNIVFYIMLSLSDHAPVSRFPLWRGRLHRIMPSMNPAAKPPM